ncbi:intraflagellar transport protein [Planoprotostelium fungivorum]|uniref:Intraflagellar transport protein n=1 Tax=Planoprotostelium fungivorum TaxID=1890364 RepID=A0A2P6NGZ6_9EUKA|nr:intraflagellar transport protein [Planoprotostelium fungivorum]
MSETVQFIVNALNNEPFKKSLTLVSFDKKAGLELVALVQAVMEEISTSQKVNIRQESPDVTAQRMVDFLWLLKYKSPVGDPFIFKQGLTEGNRKVVYPLLSWMLQRIPELRKRAYLAKFLLNFEVPTDMVQDEVYLEFKQRQNDFKEVHKAVERVRSSGFQPSDMRGALAELEKQREKLLDKLNSAKKKLDRQPDRQQLLDAAKNLRTEEEEKEKLAASIVEQQTHLTQVDIRLSAEQQKLKETQSANSDGGIMAQLNRLRENVENNGYLMNQLPQEKAAKQQWAESLRKVLNEPALSEQERQRMQQQITALRNDIKNLTTKRDSSANKVDDKLAFYRQQYNAVDKKKKEKEQALHDLYEERKELQNEYAEKENKLEQLNPGKILRGEALERYVQDLRKKTTVYKKYKAEQNMIKTEGGILARTLEILQAKEKTERGIRGHQTTQERLENISQAKSDLDADKAESLDEISKLVTEINNITKSRKAKLAPQIKALRQIRSEHQELETDYKEKKAIYETSTMGLQSESERAEQEKMALQEEAHREESRFHYLNCMDLILNMNMHKANAGADGTGSTFKEIYERATAEQDAASKTLREQQRVIKETYEPNKLQIEMFSDLKKLLKVKLKVQSHRDGSLQSDFQTDWSSNPRRGQFHRTPSEFFVKSEEPDRLVL